MEVEHSVVEGELGAAGRGDATPLGRGAMVETDSEPSSSPQEAAAATKPGKAQQADPVPSSSKKRRGSGAAASTGRKRRRAKTQISFEHLDGPTARWGHAVVALPGAAEQQGLMVFGGQTQRGVVKDAQWLHQAGSWQSVPPQEGGPAPRVGHGMANDEASEKAYLVGGAKGKKFYSDLHVFDTTAGQWSLVEVKGGKAPVRSYHSCTYYRGEILVFGGVFPNPDPQPDGCSAALHIFNLLQNNWYTPMVSGEAPSARSGHSAVILDEQLVLFGGWDAPALFDDAFALDLILMEFEKLELSGDRPTARTWHAAVRIGDSSKILIHGGYDGHKVLGDAYVLDMATRAWTALVAPPELTPRAGHKVAYKDGKLLFFGGGDNEDTFFGDVTSIDYEELVQRSP